jgi:hypothetical protein
LGPGFNSKFVDLKNYKMVGAASSREWIFQVGPFIAAGSRSHEKLHLLFSGT